MNFLAYCALALPVVIVAAAYIGVRLHERGMDRLKADL